MSEIVVAIERMVLDRGAGLPAEPAAVQAQVEAALARLIERHGLPGAGPSIARGSSAAASSVEEIALAVYRSIGAAPRSHARLGQETNP